VFAGISDEASGGAAKPQTLNTPRTSGPGVGQPVRPGAAPADQAGSKGTLAKDDCHNRLIVRRLPSVGKNDSRLSTIDRWNCGHPRRRKIPLTSP